MEEKKIFFEEEEKFFFLFRVYIICFLNAFFIWNRMVSKLDPNSDFFFFLENFFPLMCVWGRSMCEGGQKKKISFFSTKFFFLYEGTNYMFLGWKFDLESNGIKITPKF